MKISHLLIIAAVIGLASPCIGSLLTEETDGTGRAREAGAQDCHLVEPYFYAIAAEASVGSAMWMSG